MNKAGDFVFALVVYAMRCIEEGETERLVRMGIGAAEVEQLAALRFGDIQRMARLESHCLDIKVDRRAFADMIRRIRADGHAEEWEHRLIRADAPLDMMRSLYGTGSREYTRLRQLYEVSSTGRPREATADEETSDRDRRRLYRSGRVRRLRGRARRRRGSGRRRVVGRWPGDAGGLGRTTAVWRQGGPVRNSARIRACELQARFLPGLVGGN